MNQGKSFSIPDTFDNWVLWIIHDIAEHACNQNPHAIYKSFSLNLDQEKKIATISYQYCSM